MRRPHSNPAAAFFLSIFLLLSFSLFSCQKTHKPLMKDTPAPDFSVLDASGAKTTLSGLKGNVVLVNFWATWCGSCQEEMPSLNALYNKIKGYPNFRMVSIAFKDSPDAARQYLKQHSYGFSVYGDPDGQAAADYGLTGVPETYIVDKNGILRLKVIGGINWNDPQVLTFMQGLLKQ